MSINVLFNLIMLITIILFSINIVNAFKKQDFLTCYKNIKYQAIIMIFTLCNKLYTTNISLQLLGNLLVWYIGILILVKLTESYNKDN